MKKVFMGCAAILLVTAQVFSAMTAPQPFTFGLSSTDWSETLNVTKFDTSLGTLTAVHVAIAGSTNSSLTIVNTSSKKDSTGNANCQITITLTDSGALNETLTLSPVAQPYTLTKGTSTTLSGFVANNNATSVLSVPAILTAFTGPGTITLNLNAVGSTDLFTTGGNTFIDEDSGINAGSTVSISYEYIPEPATIALLSIGALTVLRKKKK
ncbi:MAG: PEP-CTERM sorting domain-containing protein [Phycisphaerales bacterium]